MSKTKIEWAEKVWNPATGCTKVSTGCENCYAESIAKRFWGDRKFTDVQCHPERLEKPLRWKKPRRIFVNSVSDLFHDDVPFSFVDKVFSVMALTPQHIYQILTKRPKRMLEYFAGLNKPGAELNGEANAEWLLGFLGYDKWREKIDSVCDYFRSLPSARPNLLLGVSVENQETADERIPLLLRTPAAKRFVSYEPALAPVNLKSEWTELELQAFGANGAKCFPRIDWVIVGSESGPHRRSCKLEWIESITEQCEDSGVPCFVKQADICGKLVKMPMIRGRIWDQIPIDTSPVLKDKGGVQPDSGKI